MKKSLLSLAAAAMLAFTAGAQNGAPLYSTGDFEASNWNPSEPVEFTFADGIYTLNVENVSMLKVSTISGAGAEDAWGAFNEGALQVVDGQEVIANKAMQLTSGDANIVFPWRGDWNLSITDDLSALIATTTTPAPEGDIAIYLRGGMNDWGAVEEWQFTSLNGDVYYLNNVVIPEDVEWKIADADWSKVNYGVAEEGEVVVLDEPFELAYNGKNIKLDYAGESVESVDVLFSLSLQQVVVAPHVEAAPLYATGDFEASNWNAEAPVQFAFTANSYVIFIKDVSLFKVSTVSGEGSDDPWSAFNNGAIQVSGGQEVIADDDVQLTPGDANIVLPWKGDWLISIDEDLEYLYAQTNTPQPTGAIDIYLRGGMNGWGVDDAWKFETADGNTYVLNGVVIPDSEEWKVADADWSKVNYGVAEDGEVVVLEEPFELEYNGKNIKLDYAGVATESVDVTFTLDDHIIVIVPAGEGGIFGIESDNAPRTYYNLQGIEVANPTTGIYLIKQGNKTVKAYIIK